MRGFRSNRCVFLLVLPLARLCFDVVLRDLWFDLFGLGLDWM